MEVAKECLEGNKVELKVEIDKEKVNNALKKAYRKVVNDITIPGFRKGKAPRKIIEARYGKEILHRDALDILIPEAYQEAVKETEIEPIAQPEINDYFLEENKPATFTAVVEVKPEVKLGEYKNLGLEKEEVSITEDEVAQELSRLQDRNSQLENTDKEFVEKNDYIIMDFEGYVDGEKFPGGSAQEYTLEIGSGSFIPGFEEQLVGKKSGEETEVKVTFPEDYQAEDLAGKEALFKVKIKEIKVKKVSELNDDFAKEASEFDTLEELKADIEERLLKVKEDRAKKDFEDSLIAKAVENSELDVSDTLINNELDMMYQNVAYTLSMQGLKVEDYFKYLGLDEKTWRENNKKDASKSAKNNLVLEAIAKKEELEITDEEIDNKIEDMSKDSEQTLEQIKSYLLNTGQLEGMKHAMLIKKTIDFLVENN